MTRILIFGLCPLPFENTSKNYGPGIRAWQFIQPIIDAGHDVTLIAGRIPFIYPPETPPEMRIVDRGFTTYHLADSLFHDPQRIQEIHDRFDPDCILCATIFATPPAAALT
ncbi:hypothetical protein JXA80_05925, partial [bacterium]|nr:hypothetical protein [candidate division CSSED10-310 bacterium]